jgi:hypothetical protein
VEFHPSFISIDTFNCDAFLADAGTALPIAPGLPAPPDAEAGASLAGNSEATDAWTAQFARALQAQHARVREFLQTQRDRWRQVAAHFTRQIETLQAHVQSLEETNEGLRLDLAAQDLSGQLAEGDPSAAAEDMASVALSESDEIRALKARNAELQRQLIELQSPGQRENSEASSGGGNWESQKRRLLENLQSDDQHDAEASERRSKIEEIVARTDKIIAEKNREIEELRYLLNSQSNSLGSLAIGAAALEQVFDSDAIIVEERQRLQQLQEECRAKLREAEIQISMERARLARRDAEIEEKIRNNDVRRTAADAESDALAPTGRPIRGRWRTQLGLTDDDPPEPDRRR